MDEWEKEMRGLIRSVAGKVGWCLDTECHMRSDKEFGLCPLGKRESSKGYINKESLDQV